MTTTDHGILGTFAGHAFLNDLGDRHRMTLACGARPFTAGPGQYLARAGQPANAFYLIQSGRVAVGTRTPEGRLVPVQTVGPGQVLGWSWLVPPHTWQFDCQAAEPVSGLSFDAEWLREKCEQDHELGYHLLRHLMTVVAERLVSTRRRLAGARG
jgi:CRP/FNR family transcriptional regulator, cyclic AMP receptor protein